MAFDLQALRDALRAARKDKKIGRDALALKIGKAKSTVQSAEMGPDIPGIDTVALMIEGLDLTLSTFFTQFDEPPNRYLKLVQSSEQDADFPEGDADASSEFGRLANTLAHTMLQLSRLELAASNKPPATARDAKPSRRSRLRERGDKDVDDPLG